MLVQQDLSRIASRFGHRLGRQARPHRVGADDKIGYQSILPHQLSHPRPVPPSALIQRSLMIITRRIVPARLRVPENQQSLHPHRSVTPSTGSTSTWVCCVMKSVRSLNVKGGGEPRLEQSGLIAVPAETSVRAAFIDVVAE